jgi:uncharacterized cupin superfamily protein
MAVPEAELVQTDNGLAPKGDGWYVLNAREAEWLIHPKFGCSAAFEGDVRFPQVGIHVEVLKPGQPNCHYHAEDVQEDFLILAGECILLVEGEERPLKAWDFIHCPEWTEHVFVGAGDTPCILLSIGARKPDDRVVYPVVDVALKHEAGVTVETRDPDVSYAGTGEITRIRYPDGALPEIPPPSL